jgi:hypothetical protein
MRYEVGRYEERSTCLINGKGGNTLAVLENKIPGISKHAKLYSVS